MTALPTAFTKFVLTGKTAVVTGGGTGLGYFIARGLARSGAKGGVDISVGNAAQDCLEPGRS